MPETKIDITSPILADAGNAQPKLSWLGVPDFRWSVALFGLCIFTFVIVTYYFQVGTIGIAIAMVGLFLQKEKLRAPYPVWLFGAFVAWTLLASFFSPYPQIAMDNVTEFAKLLAIFFVAVNALRTEGQIRFYLLLFLGCFVLFPIRGTLVGGDSLSGRAVWNYIYSNPNDLATLCLVALGVAAGFLLSRLSPIYVRLGALASAVLILIVMLLTESRGAFIGLIAGMGPAFLGMALKRPIRAVFLAALLAAIATVAVPQRVWDRLSGIEKLTSTSTIAEADAEGSAAERYEIQKVGWKIFADHPVFGVGLGAYPSANAEYAPELGRRDTHNTYLNLLAETGLPGAVLWLVCFGSVMVHSYRIRRTLRPSALSIQQLWLERAFVAYLVAAVVGTYSKLTFPYLILAVLWCSTAVLAQSRPAAEPSRKVS